MVAARIFLRGVIMQRRIMTMKEYAAWRAQQRARKAAVLAAADAERQEREAVERGFAALARALAPLDKAGKVCYNRAREVQSFKKG